MSFLRIAKNNIFYCVFYLNLVFVYLFYPKTSIIYKLRHIYIESVNVESFGYCNDEERGKM